MQQVLKQSTAATTIVGPVLDLTGASYTGAVIGDLNLTKNGTTAAMAAAATLTHDHNGHYVLVFTTGNTDTLGRLDVTLNKATYAMPPKCFEVLSSTTFDAIVTNGTLASTTSGRTLNVGATGIGEANLVQYLGSACPTADTAGYPRVTLKTGVGAGEIDLSGGDVKLWSPDSPILNRGTAQNGSTSAIVLDTGASATTDLYKGNVVTITANTGVGQSRVITAYNGGTKTATVDWNWTTAPDSSSSYVVKDYCPPKVDSSLQVVSASVQGNVTGSVASVTGAVGSIATGGIVAATFAAGAIDAAAIATDAIGSAELAASAVTEIVNGVWDELRSGHVTAGTFGEYVLADAKLISGDSTAADNLETMLDGTGGQTLSLGALTVSGNTTFTGTTTHTGAATYAAGIAITQSTTNGDGLSIAGNGTGMGLRSVGGATGDGVRFTGGATSGDAVRFNAAAGNGNGLNATGNGSGAGILGLGGTSGNGIQGSGQSGAAGIRAAGGSVGGHGINSTGGTSGAGAQFTGGTTGAGIRVVGGSTSGNAFYATATSGDGMTLVGGGSGYDLNADIQGSLSGAVSVGGTTWYVATTGSDSNAGTTVAAPFLTISQAQSVAVGGDTVLIADGTYAENTGAVGYFNLNKSYTGTVTFKSRSGVAANVVITGASDATFNTLTGAANAGYRFEDVTFGSRLSTNTSAVRLTQSSAITFVRVVFNAPSSNAATRYGLQAVLSGATTLANLTCEDCVFEVGSNTTANGVEVNAGTTGTITAPRFINCIGNGSITAMTFAATQASTSSITDALIDGGTYTSTGSYGIKVGQDSSTALGTIDLTIRNATIDDSAGTGHGVLLGAGAGGSVLEYSTVLGGDYGVVVKENAACVVQWNHLIGGTFSATNGSALYLKGATGAKVRRNTIEGSRGTSGVLRIGVGDSANKSGTYTVIHNTVIAHGVDALNLDGSSGDSGGGTFDRNLYDLRGGASFGTVYGTAVTTWKGLIAAWATYDVTTNDAKSARTYPTDQDYRPIVDQWNKKFSISGTTLTTKRDDGTTTDYTRTLTTDPSAQSITGSS